MEHWISGTDGGNLKHLDKNLSYYDCVFQTKINLNYIYLPSPYRAVNALRLGYTKQSVNVV